MRYDRLRTTAVSGDLLLVEGKSWFSRLVRGLTGQQFSHVAMLLWLDTGLYVAEMKEGKGFVITPASQWVQSSGYLYYGPAPDIVNQSHARARMEILELRGKQYGYLSLIKVWLSQFTQKYNKNRHLVCSTAVQRVWEACGYKFEQTPDPGDFARLCAFIIKLER